MSSGRRKPVFSIWQLTIDLQELFRQGRVSLLLNFELLFLFL